MGSAVVLIVLVVLAVGCYAGWHMRHAYGANSDLKVHKNRIPNFRKTRNRSGLISLGLLVLILFMLRVLLK